MTLELELQAAAELKLTCVVTSDPVTDDDGKRWQQVYEYENGECVDRYVTQVGVQI